MRWRKSIKAQKSIVIKAEAEKIWPLIVEPGNIGKWCSPVIRILQTGEQSSGLGSTFYFEERAMGRLLQMNFIVTEWEFHRSVAFKLISGNLVKGYEQRYTLESTPTGLNVTCFENVKLPFGILGKFAGLFRKSVTEAHLERNLVDLKTLAEAC